MKTFTPIQKSILKQLEDGQCHTGTDLGRHLDVSRTAIWKQIKQLIDLGLPIHSVNKQGYQLSKPLILLNETHIKDQLNSNKLDKTIELHLFSSLDSTNRYLKDLPPSSKLEICCAETQTQGRGRFGREWHSPLAENIYFSSRWQLHCDFSRLSGLSLIVSLAIVETLKTLYTDDFKIKWPNDILWQAKKLCGILIEVVGETNGNAMVIIGIGLNVNSNTLKNPLPDKQWCSLLEITGYHQNRNHLISSLIIHLNNYLQQFMKTGFASFKEQWMACDYLAGQKVTVNQPTGVLEGVAKGVNAAGELVLIDNDGETAGAVNGGNVAQQNRAMNDLTNKLSQPVLPGRNRNGGEKI